MTKNKNTYVVITGGTTGIGYELAKVFADNHFNLILVDPSLADEVRQFKSVLYKNDETFYYMLGENESEDYRYGSYRR